ncbi:MAG TPA: ABC transporter permease [Candidatus Dormibacteraeota bacterium]|jgi:putative ABC transport system permease protein|nr:ABC transporter permease [Candidatus Dormibacteraeota bacterium]
MLAYVLRDLLRNPRRTLASVAGVALAVGLLSAIAFFVDASSAQMTTRAISPVTIDMQAVVTAPLGSPVANSPKPIDLATLRRDIGAVSGVSGAAPFMSVDLPAGSLLSGGNVVDSPVTVAAVDTDFLGTFPVIQVTRGSIAPASAALSGPAADRLAAAQGASVELAVPGSSTPLRLPVSGVVDLSQATQLFTSRSPDTQGEASGSPYVIIVDTATFSSTIIPALRADAASSSPAVKTPPVVEVDVAISRQRLSSDPTSAQVTTQGLRRTIERVAPGQITVIDNLTDALTAAGKDTVLAKVLFIFLGLPGVLLAAYLSRYAGGLLAEAQRRERATLRARGIRPAMLLRALAINTAAITVIGSALGLGLGYAFVSWLGGAATSRPPASSYVISIAIALLGAVLTTTVALYVPARRALMREVAEERREVALAVTPFWMRARIDCALLAMAAIVGLVTWLTGGYKPTPAAEGQSVSLSFYVLLAPLLFWVGGTLIIVRGLLTALERMRTRTGGADFDRHMVRRTVLLSVVRRPQALASGVIALSLTAAFGVSLMTFVSTYQAEQLADARFVVGGDVRVTPGLGATIPATFTNGLVVPGVQQVTAIAQSSSVVVGTEKRSMVGVDPATFPSVAHLEAGFFVDTTPQQAIDGLNRDPQAVLIDQELARTFNVQTGDTVHIQVPSQAGQPVPLTLHAIGMFTNFPGFPQGIDLVGNLATFQAATGSTTPSVYLLRTDGSDATNSEVVSAIKAGPGRSTTLLLDSTTTAVNREQSTLAALNLDGLGRLEIAFTVLMSALGVGIFVFGLLLQRRKEHVTLRALGLRGRSLRTLVLGEAGLAAVISLLVGTGVGLLMALMSVQILQSVFTIPPRSVTLPPAELGLLGGAILVLAVLASTVAGEILRRVPLVELLREE